MHLIGLGKDLPSQRDGADTVSVLAAGWGLGHNCPGSQGLELESSPKLTQGTGPSRWLDLPCAVHLPAAGGGTGEGAGPTV